jgi:DNA-binding response OmpR family regulator
MEESILIVDDEKAIIGLLEVAFSTAGYKVVSAQNAEEALSILKDKKIFVMFLDLNLPGMDGIDLCREIKNQIPMAMVFAITGYASLFELADCREAGFDDYFKKPVNIKMLIKTAKDAFEKINRWKNC